LGEQDRKLFAEEIKFFFQSEPPEIEIKSIYASASRILGFKVSKFFVQVQKKVMKVKIFIPKLLGVLHLKHSVLLA
jgi:hypothetical protein